MPSTQPPDSSSDSAQPLLMHPGVTRGGTSLPHPLTQLIARDDECVALGVLLRDSNVRFVTLTGPGGVGKTRLAIAVAEADAGFFRDGVAFVNLAPVTAADLVIPAVAWALGLRDISIALSRELLIASLANQHMLLLLDNFEHVVEAAPVVTSLLEGCPHLKILVTSRIRLRLSGEREFPVSPLPMREDAAGFGAVRLFTERAQAVQPDFRLTHDTLPAVTEIVRLVDGLPLAIELAAARTRALPLSALLHRLEQRLPLLSGGARDLPLRQQTMRDTIAWSYDLLNAKEQELFRHLAVFVGGFTLEAAETLASPDLHPVDILDAITSLIEHSVVQPNSGPLGTTRYVMLETIREYALELMREEGEEEDLRRRHALAFLLMAETAEPALTGPQQAAWLDRLTLEYPNLQSALGWGLANDVGVALRLATALRTFWRNRGHLGEGRAWLEGALASGEGAPLLRAKAMVAAASICNAQSEPEHALAHAEAARAMFVELDDRLGIAEALRRIAPYYLFAATADQNPDHAGFARADALWEEELTLRRELEDRHGLAWVQHNLGVSALHRGDLVRAAAWLEEALAHLESLEDTDGVAVTLIDLGRALAQQENTERAAELFGRGFALLQELGDKRNTVHLLEDVAHLAAQTNQLERASRLSGAVDTLRDANGHGLLTIHRGLYEWTRREARRVLGDPAFATARHTGSALRLDEAIALALDTLSAIAVPAVPPDRATVAQELGLTEREREVLQLLVEGLSDRDIAEVLSVSPRTVGWHVNHLLTKLNVSSRTAAATSAIRLGLI